MEIYHYTDAHALMSILESRSLWLTRTDFLNDKTEGEELRDMLSERLADIPAALGLLKIVDNSTETYSLSFSTESDLLSQWRGYCPVYGGYNIGFDEKLLSAPLQIKDSNEREMNFPYRVNDIENIFSGNSLNMSLARMKCIYKRDDKLKCVEEIVRLVNDAYRHAMEVDSYLLEKLSVVGVDGLDDAEVRVLKAVMNRNSVWSMNYINYKFLFKNESFFEEHEYRFFATCEKGSVTPFYRVNGNVLVPYIKVILDQSLFRSISIGPCRDFDLAKRGLNSFLGNKFPTLLDDVNITKIPFR